MDASDTAGRILLLGAGAVGKHGLLQSIRGQETEQQPAGSFCWRLDNKYYTADLQFDVRHVDQCAQLQLDSAGYEAVLLVFDASQQASFDSVRRWYEAAGGGDAELGVRLAVSTRADSLPRGTDGEPAKPSWLLAAEEWCADQLVEYVETSGARQEGQEQEAAAASTGGEGATGVQRIREALEAHMWMGLQLKPSPRHGLAASAAAPAVEQGQEGGVEDAVPAPVATNGASVHPSSSSSSPGADKGPGFTDYLGAPDEAVAVAGLASSRAVGQEEVEVEQLEQLLAQVASHRAQVAQLPDAQRRETAAAMVMQLMAAMGLVEEDEEGEEDGCREE